MDAVDLASYERFLPRTRNGFGTYALAAEPETPLGSERTQNNITGIQRLDTLEMPLGTSALAARVTNAFKQCPFKAVEVVCSVLNDPGSDNPTHQLALSVGDGLYGQMYDRGKYDAAMRDAAKILEMELGSQPQHRERAYNTRNALSRHAYNKIASAWIHNANSVYANEPKQSMTTSTWAPIFAGAAANTANDHAKDRALVKPGNFYVAPSPGLQ
jgi:hypothetical protein